MQRANELPCWTSSSPAQRPQTKGVRASYTVRELMGHTLAEMTKRRAAVYSRAEAACVFSAMTSGVAHLHAHEIVHADLSADNVLMNGWSRGQHGELKCDCRICDFGCAFDWPHAA